MNIVTELNSNISTPTYIIILKFEIISIGYTWTKLCYCELTLNLGGGTIEGGMKVVVQNIMSKAYKLFEYHQA
jgi:hypothetical protein